MTSKHIKLAWDINDSLISINGVGIIVAADKLEPFPIDAEIEEQDTALILGPPSDILNVEKNPGWLLANKLESQILHEPGSVFKRTNKPLRLSAIVHNLDEEPTWKQEWVAQALHNMTVYCNADNIRTIKLPILGRQYGKMETLDFLMLLVTSLQESLGNLEKIWLVTNEEEYAQVISFLKRLS